MLKKYFIKLVFLTLSITAVSAAERGVRLSLENLVVKHAATSFAEVAFRVEEQVGCGHKGKSDLSSENWTFKEDRVERSVLWQGQLQEQESIQLILSLEHGEGVAPVVLTVLNESGNIKYRWNEEESSEPRKTFVFKGADFEYEAQFLLEDNS